MDSFLSKQNEENQFLKVKKQTFKIPKKLTMVKFQKHKILQNDQIDMMEKTKNEISPIEILQSSRIKVLNKIKSKSQHSNQLNHNKNQNSYSISRLSNQSNLAEKIFKDRFLQYKNRISSKINTLAAVCDQNFGGIQNINKELSKHSLTKQQLISYYAKMLPQNIVFPKIGKHNTSDNPKLSSNIRKLKSLSEKNLQRNQTQVLKFNKWYIDPKIRFSIEKQRTKYDWKTQDGIKNVIKTRDFKLSGKQIKDLINDVKQKYHREPIFCKYAKFC